MKRYTNSVEHKDWSKAVRDRDGRCQICNATADEKRLNAHHLIPKNFKKWRSTLDNGMTLCYGCHTGGRYSAHKHPIWFYQWLKDNKPYTLQLIKDRILECNNTDGTIK